MNTSPERSPHDEVIVGAGLNDGRVRASSILAVWISMFTSSNMALAKTSSESTALLLFTVADVSALRKDDGQCPLSAAGVQVGARTGAGALLQYS